MKRIIIALTALITIATTSMAQDDIRRERPSKEEMAKHRTEAMVKQYDLNESQQAKLLELNTKYAEKMGPMQPRRPGGPHREMVRPDNNFQQAPVKVHPDHEKRHKEMEATMEAYNNELKEIMTEEQFKKYQEESLKMRRGGPRGHHGPRPGQEMPRQ